MGISEILGLLGGLALFLYGMQMMSNGLEDVAGNRMEKILKKLTSNRFLGVLVGAVITAIIQSSSATTVMVVGFVNSGLMTLTQAVWIIMGANIGTTITGQLIALDVGFLAPLIAFLGVVLVVFFKSPKTHNIGKIIAGLGILFIGMNMMSSSMGPLHESEAFISLMTKFRSPLLGIAAGAIFTAIIQSSSASVGILQALAIAGLIEFDAAIFVLFGQNIGTCITAVLAAIGTNRAAKRTTIIHLLFNLIGTTVFTIVCLLLPITDWVSALSPLDPAKQIANMHTVFNVVTTILLIPFGVQLAKLAEKILPNPKTAPITSFGSLSDEYTLGNVSLGLTAVHTDVLRQEIFKMIDLSSKNSYDAYSAVINNDIALISQIEKNEEKIDMLNKEISGFISKILVHNNSPENVDDIEKYFLICSNTERIGDHAINIAGYSRLIFEKGIVFSEEAKNELLLMQEIITSSLEMILSENNDKKTILDDIASAEEKIDKMTEEYRKNHLDRMRKGECTEEGCIIFSELLTDFERIGDHILNISQALSKITSSN